MAYRELQEFYMVTAVLDAGGVEAYKHKQADGPSGAGAGTEAYGYQQLVTAAKVVGPIALECLDAQFDTDNPLTRVPQPDTQIVRPRVEKIMQIKGRSLFRGSGKSQVKQAIIKSYSPTAEGWSLVDEVYEFPDETPDIAERIVLDTEGDLTLVQGTRLVQPEESKLIVPVRVKEVPETVSREYDELLLEARAVGRARPDNYDEFTSSAYTEIDYIGNALMDFTVKTGLEYELSLRMLDNK